MERTTACLSELKAVRQLHDTHPVVAALVQAVEERDITAYSQAYEILQGVERTRREEQLRAQVEAALRVAVPGLVECVTATWLKRRGTTGSENGRPRGDGLSPKTGCANARMPVIGSGYGSAARKPTARSAHCLVKPRRCVPGPISLIASLTPKLLR